MNREMGAVASRPTSKPVSQRASASAVLPGAPISRSARIGVLSDIPAGQSEVGVVSVYKPSAATVTQAGGVECALPASSHLVQKRAGRPGGNSEPRELRGLPASVGEAR